MRFSGILLVSLFSIIPAAAAQESASLSSQLTMLDYFIIFLVGIIVLNLFVAALRRIFHKAPEKKRSTAANVLGSLLAIGFLVVGSFAVIIPLLALIAVLGQVEVFAWLVVLLVYWTGSLPVGILVPFIGGFGLFLLGVYLLVLFQNPSMEAMFGVPTKSRTPADMGRSGIPEHLNPSVTYRVYTWNRAQPVTNARVILKQTNGTRFYTRTTNIEGEITFDHIEGFASDYYAYVEGDERREQYRVIRVDAREER
jgi:hypothetical protein